MLALPHPVRHSSLWCVVGLKETGLDWCLAVMVGSTMVGAVLLAAFTRDELLAECLVSCSTVQSWGLSAPCPATVVTFACALAGGSVNPLRGIDPIEESLLVMSRRMSYLLVDSNTGGEVGEWHICCVLEVKVARPITGGGVYPNAR